MKLPKNEYRISIISSCNMKCTYCHNEGNKINSLLSIEDIDYIVSNSKSLGLKRVRLTGGEPLIHRQIVDICQLLKEKYSLEVGINTNAIEIDKLLYLINKKWIDRVVVGIDYYDAKISKNSKTGKSSSEILSNVLKIRDSNCDVSISTVYNDDYKNIKSLLKWCIDNNIRLKIIEVVKNEIFPESDDNYIKMRKRILNDFVLESIIDSKYREVQGILDNKIVVSFFHSHCRLRECDLCKNMHLRITSTGKLKTCLHYNDDDIDIRDGNFEDNVKKILCSPVNYHK